jgi:hypothetical protein
VSTAAIVVSLMPGLVLASLQGIWHVTDADFPRICFYGWDMPTWMVYGLIVLAGPALLAAIILQIIGKGIRS